MADLEEELAKLDRRVWELEKAVEQIRSDNGNVAFRMGQELGSLYKLLKDNQEQLIRMQERLIRDKAI